MMGLALLVPQWRVGYVAAAPALAERLIDTKMLGTLTTPAPLEQAVAWCLEQGALRRHAERVTALLAAARSRTVRLAREAGCRFAAPPEGLFGGKPGARAQFLVNGQPGNPYGLTRLRPGDTVIMDAAGGGGYGDPKERDRALLLRDVRDGKVTRESALRDYGVEITDEMLKSQYA